MALWSAAAGSQVPQLCLCSPREPTVPEQLVCVQEAHSQETKFIRGHAATIVNIIHSDETSHRCSPSTAAGKKLTEATDSGRAGAIRLRDRVASGKTRASADDEFPDHA
jgi:hypothetical protein